MDDIHRTAQTPTAALSAICLQAPMPAPLVRYSTAVPVKAPAPRARQYGSSSETAVQERYVRLPLRS
jgi:hypothetical protein